MTVPEAAMNEDYSSSAGENYVWRTREASSVKAISEAFCKQQPPHR